MKKKMALVAAMRFLMGRVEKRTPGEGNPGFSRLHVSGMK